jgi:poly(A) polymerase
VVPLLIGVAVERTHRELFGLFAASPSSPHVATMARLGLLDVLFPELVATQDIPCPPGDDLDVLDHSIRTYQAVEALISDPGAYLQPIAGAIVEYFRAEERRALVKWAALLHTIGDATVCQPAPPKLAATSPSAPEPAQQWELIGSRLKMSRKEIDYVRSLIVHYDPTFRLAMLEAQGQLTVRSVHRWCKGIEEDMLAVFVLAIGHALARAEGPVAEPDVTLLAALALRVWDMYRHRILPVIAAPRLLTGVDLQHVFHLPPGPLFKVLLDELEVAQVEGRIRTRSEALEWVAAQLP